MITTLLQVIPAINRVRGYPGIFPTLSALHASEGILTWYADRDTPLLIAGLPGLQDCFAFTEGEFPQVKDQQKQQRWDYRAVIDISQVTTYSNNLFKKTRRKIRDRRFWESRRGLDCGKRLPKQVADGDELFLLQRSTEGW
jgi:hypothetical protein